MKQIYLDNAATTKPDSAVVDAMLPYLKDNFGNPSSLYSIGQQNKTAINNAREKVASVIGANSNEIFFTSGGSESDNWVIKCIAKPGDHIITSKIEHHAILNACKYMESCGVEVTYLDVDENGMVSPADIEKAIKYNTVLISIMFANNEIGTIQPIKEIGEIAERNCVLFHTDAVQAFGHILIDVNKLGIDLLSCSAHKLNGPKGVGALYIKECEQEKIFSFIDGGGQEFGKRASTENVPGIVGFGVAAEMAKDDINQNILYERKLVQLLSDLIAEDISGVKFNGCKIGDYRLPNNLNISIAGIRGEELMMLLSMNGCYVSTGSACNSGDDKPSYVLKAIGLTDEEANSSIRITISKETSVDDIIIFAETLKLCVEQLRIR